eukprot:CAMPEP_0176091522 /NCGR_PEP_ID=MMETSP0120_2-20121206/45843_1 /TAXON_ID=160619 /ORGANISM="Kryptoperidinium foliaceum, Strain CCMP 1326" /LENGTH=38 /DNA_ID= /DNA_START= /DNA_END= /DNA_ORIENTATION=
MARHLRLAAALALPLWATALADDGATVAAQASLDDVEA